MSLYLKSLQLTNYCGYRDIYLDFMDGKTAKNIALFYGPNGCGKTTILNAIRSLSFPWQFQGRNVDLLFRKLTFHRDYNPALAGFIQSKGMRAHAAFLHDDKEKNVVFENTGESAVVSTCELEKEDCFHEAAFFVDADNPLNTSRFQINSQYLYEFLDLARSIYGFECEVSTDDLTVVEEYDAETKEHVKFHTDFIIHKPNGTRVHFRTMSAGERKIATLLSLLCSPLHMDNYDIFLVDNLSMHVYFKRHRMMVDKFLQHFPNKQIICTDHSGILINYVEDHFPRYAFDLDRINK